MDLALNNLQRLICHKTQQTRPNSHSVWLLLLLLLLQSFWHQRQLLVFHWSLRDSKSPQVSRTLLSIVAVLNNFVVWMFSTRLPTYNSSCSFNNPLVTVPKAPITIGIIVTFMFHSFSIPLKGRGTYTSFHFLSVLLYGLPGQQTRQFCKFFFFFFFVDNYNVWSSDRD